LTSDYQKSMSFMSQQVAKLTTSNDTKNAEIKKLYEELHETKRKFEEDLKEVDQRMKN
jgi:prefoldin subunit 5